MSVNPSSTKDSNEPPDPPPPKDNSRRVRFAQLPDFIEPSVTISPGNPFRGMTAKRTMHSDGLRPGGGGKRARNSITGNAETATAGRGVDRGPAGPSAQPSPVTATPAIPVGPTGSIFDCLDYPPPIVPFTDRGSGFDRPLEILPCARNRPRARSEDSLSTGTCISTTAFAPIDVASSALTAVATSALALAPTSEASQAPASGPEPSQAPAPAAVPASTPTSTSESTSAFTPAFPPAAPATAARAAISAVGNNHTCNKDGCSYTCDTARGITEHCRSKHLGNRCYWMNEQGGFCNHTTATEADMCDHFDAHIETAFKRMRAGKSSNSRWQCPWAGSPGHNLATGVRTPEESACTRTYDKKGGAQRHACFHQFDISDEVKHAANQAANGQSSNTQANNNQSNN
ncbi:hypothetical protein F4777DRAFT_600589 [Nemania sp. FL0916]|nr:hypothetical protein F4777DRAFT_600589 [Nemania sp. FL0916]